MVLPKINCPPSPPDVKTVKLTPAWSHHKLCGTVLSGWSQKKTGEPFLPPALGGDNLTLLLYQTGTQNQWGVTGQVMPVCRSFHVTVSLCRQGWQRWPNLHQDRRMLCTQWMTVGWCQRVAKVDYQQRMLCPCDSLKKKQVWWCVL